MSKAWKVGLFGLVVFSLVWLVTLWRWQTADVDVGGAEIVTHLVVLPLLLLLTLWAAQKMALSVRTAGVSTPAAPVSQSADAAVAAAGADEALRRFSVAVVDARLSLTAGESLRDVADLVRERQVWPTLDEALQDLDGNPVFSARVSDLDGRAGDEDEPAQVARARALLWRAWWPLQARLSEVLASEAFVRMLGQAPDDEAAVAAAERPAHLAGLASARPVARPAAGRLTITVLLALPADWSPEQREQTLQQLQRSLPDHLPQEADGLRWSWALLTEREPDALWSQVDGVLLSWARSGDAASLLILSADSALDDEVVAQRQARGELFTAVHQQGRIPGEGAAALWLASPAWPGLAALEPAPMRLHRPVIARRDKSADALGRVGSTVLQQALRAAQSLPVVPASHALRTVCLVSDADHRASRTSELYESLTELWPELDPVQSVCRLGDACGDLGLVGALAPVVLATGLVSEPCAPADGGDPPWPLALAACVQSPWQRVVLAVSPWVPVPGATD